MIPGEGRVQGFPHPAQPVPNAELGAMSTVQQGGLSGGQKPHHRQICGEKSIFPMAPLLPGLPFPFSPNLGLVQSPSK